ncbi:penicillin-binding protein activator LpoB [Acetobacteraceae bacterium H6797]|nr:penicillin-binding protein activator LpoB [Acetobacteraceae bacterium H6797]
MLALAACAPQQPYASGVQTMQLDPSTRGPVGGVGIEGQDIMAMTDQMMRDMLQNPLLANASRPPQVIIDAQYFQNLSSQRLNVNAITDRLRVGLTRASQGRMVFVSRESFGMVAQERQMRRSGQVDVGTRGLTRAQAGADYRLVGRINSIDQRSMGTGMVQRYNQISFEMVDMERGTIVWSGIYEFARAAADDIVYR